MLNGTHYFSILLVNLIVADSNEAAKGTDVYVVCDRKDDQGIQVSRKEISDNIFSQRLSMSARRHLRDLRRDAVVEYR